MPLLTVVKFGAFLIYATPLIYAQDGSEHSPTKVKTTQRPEMPKVSGFSQGKIEDFGSLRSQFSHLH